MHFHYIHRGINLLIVMPFQINLITYKTFVQLLVVSHLFYNHATPLVTL